MELALFWWTVFAFLFFFCSRVFSGAFLSTRNQGKKDYWETTENITKAGGEKIIGRQVVSRKGPLDGEGQQLFLIHPTAISQKGF